MKVLFVSSECNPFAKSGGLGEVAGSLPQEVSRKGVSMRVILPLYGTISDEWRSRMTFVKSYSTELGWRVLYTGLFELKLGRIVYYFIDNEYYFKRDQAYGYFDDGERYAFFSKAVVQTLRELDDWKPDLLHLNDWQTGLIPIYLREAAEQEEFYGGIKTLFTIHNIEYQGRFAAETLEDVCGLSKKRWYTGVLEYMGDIDILKGAIITADHVSTVSPTYASELQYPFFACGLDGVIAGVSDRFCGILNGIDTVGYDPETDKYLPANYSAAKPKNKAANKADLQKILGLREGPDTPLIVSITRLVAHKGLDLILSTMDAIMESGTQFVVLGTGDYKYEQFFRMAEKNYPGRLVANIMFSEDMARRMYAAGDIFLMPSQKEPCGLSQMIAMRYGTIPIVRETGGLNDTVFPYPGEDCNGFTFANYNPSDMLYVIREAVAAYHYDRPGWEAMMRRGMESDFSWNQSALEYKRLYSKITGKK